MTDLIFSIFASTLIIIIFKVFELKKISVLQAIVINYAIAGSIGLAYNPSGVSLLSIVHEPWFLNAVILGCIFIVIFQVMAITTQKLSGSVTSVSGKMSMAISVVFGFIYFHEPWSILKIVGIVIAFISVFLITPLKNKTVQKKYMYLPIVLFLGSGFIDSFINYNQQVLLEPGESVLFLSVIFMVAFLAGLPMVVYSLAVKKEKIYLRNITGGVILGIINWFSLLFLLKALAAPQLTSSMVYPLNNVGIVICTVLSGVIIFKERPNKLQWIGVILAITAILLIWFF